MGGWHGGLLPTRLDGVTRSPGSMMKLTLTLERTDPIANVTVPVYLPTASVEFKVEADIVTLPGAPPPSVPPVGLAVSQFPPSNVFAVADHIPVAPQFASDTVCGAASLT